MPQKTLRMLFKAAALAMAMAVTPAVHAQSQQLPFPPPGAYDMPHINAMTADEKIAAARAIERALNIYRGPVADEKQALARLIDFATGPEPESVRKIAAGLLVIVARDRPDLSDPLLPVAETLAIDPVADIRRSAVNIAAIMPHADTAQTKRKVDLIAGVMAAGGIEKWLPLPALRDIALYDRAFDARIIDLVTPYISSAQNLERRYARETLIAIAASNSPESTRAMDTIKIPMADPSRRVMGATNFDMYGSYPVEVFAFAEALGALRDIAANPSFHDTPGIITYLEGLTRHASAEVRFSAATEITNIALAKPAFATHYMDAVENAVRNDPATNERWQWEFNLEQLWDKTPSSAVRLVGILEQAMATTGKDLRYAGLSRAATRAALDNPQLLPRVMAAFRATIDDTSSDYRHIALGQMTEIFKAAPAPRDEIFSLLIKNADSGASNVALISVRGLTAAVKTDAAYADPALQAASALLSAPAITANARRELADTAAAVFTGSAVHAEAAFALLRTMADDKDSTLRRNAINRLAAAIPARPAYTDRTIALANAMLSFTDRETRIAVLEALGTIGENGAAAAALDILAPHAENTGQPAFARIAALTEMADIAARHNTVMARVINRLSAVAQNSPADIAAAAVTGLVKIGNSGQLAPRAVLQILEPFEKREAKLQDIVREPLRKLRELMGFENLRQGINDESAMTAELPAALQDLTKAQALLPRAIALLHAATDNPTTRQRATEIVGSLGYEHASLAADAAHALVEAAFRNDLANVAATHLVILKKLGMMAMRHESTADATIDAAARLTAHADPTIAGMAVTALGMIGGKYPQECADALHALQQAASQDNVPGRNAQTQITRLRCPAP